MIAGRAKLRLVTVMGEGSASWESAPDQGEQSETLTRARGSSRVSAIMPELEEE